MKERVTEKLVTEAWQSLLATTRKLKTETGQTLTVIYPGRTSDAPGSDFQDAVIRVGRQDVRGNIEVHVRSGDWRKHGHHRNPVYNGVVLHVVMWHGCPYETKLQNGAVIPTVTLNNLKNGAAVPLAGALVCSGMMNRAGDRLLKVIDEAGVERFREKAAGFQSDMADMEAGQCLYRGIMQALGYGRNREPFLALAQRVPLSVLERVAQNYVTETERLLYRQVLLMGTAGLLPSQRSGGALSSSDPCVNELEMLWKTAKHGDIMFFTDWQTFRVRPSNAPLRRLAGMSILIRRYQEGGLLNGLVELVSRVASEKNHYQLAAGLMVAGNGYWTGHFDFGRQCRGLSPWLIGQSRAAVIAINVLFPFIYAWGEENGRIELAEKALALYGSYPALATNTIERHMRTQFGLKGAQVNSALRQQGLLHLYKKWCTQGRCGECKVASL
ncbi:MAG: DUF2851 family protein [Dehalococcoidales bacterium]|nr:DUF2851 family protein [Dehalococcoidales bacterium]